MLKALSAVAAVALCLASVASAERDPITGVWVAHDVAGDGSTDRFIFSGPSLEGLRSFTLVDSYGTFCETSGEGSGSPLIGEGTATFDAATSTLSTTLESYVCGNGNRGTLDPPLTGQAKLTEEGLDDGYYVAVRSGS